MMPTSPPAIEAVQPLNTPLSQEAVALAVAIEIAAIASEGTSGLAARLRQNAGYELAEDCALARTHNQRGALLHAIADQLDALA